MRLFGSIRVGSVMRDGWKHPLPLYAFRCEKHDIQTSYPHGNDEVLLCDECLRARAN